MIMLMALLEVVGVASIMPFMALLANPELVQTNAMLASAYQAARSFGVTTVEQFMFVLGVSVFLLLVTSLAFRAFTTYVQLRFTLMREYSIGKRLVEGYLNQPYSWFLCRHSADLGKSILSEVSAVIHGALVPAMTTLAQGAVVFALLVFLIMVDPALALGVGLVLAIAYASIFKLMGGYLSRIGSERVKANQERFTAVSEAFGAAKEVKVGGLEQIYTRRFEKPAQIYAKHQASAQAVAQLPRYALEAVAFGGMILLVLVLMARSGGFASALPVIALYAFAGYRLMPALQQIYAALSQLKFAEPALNALHKDMASLDKSPQNALTSQTITLSRSLQLNNIVYTYPGAERAAINNLTLTIPARSTVGFVGSTGSGKTTTVDIILGLLTPSKGSIAVDDVQITTENVRAWQRTIGYVPQHIYLADDTVAANIAFGLPPEKIDHQAVERAARIANLHDFVVNDMPQGYATRVGERGVRLSGGQRQRIGIARALYHDPEVLILDEATSALDNLTEKAVMEAVNNLGHNIMIILIAHRLSTVRQCDQIFVLDKGGLIECGKYEDLIVKGKFFRNMTDAGCSQ